MTGSAVHVAVGEAAVVADRVHARLLEAGSVPSSPGAVREAAARLVRREAPLLATGAAEAAVEEVVARVGGLGPLDALLADSAVTEVMANGPGPVWVERHGRLERTDVVLSGDRILQVVERIVAPLGLRVDRRSPMVDARLRDGSRVNVVVPPLAVDGPCLTIRRFAARALPVAAFASAPVATLLSRAVRARANIVVSGGTGAGKTTLLNALAAAAPAGERIITVEDAAELQLPGEHVVRLEARPGNVDGVGEVAIRDLVRNALRMRPDRIVVGETRGAEALDMLQAMNTGHEGSLSTCHANSPDDALRRVETMVLLGGVGLSLAAVREQVHAAVDLVVHVARRSGGSRAVVAVAEPTPTPPGDGRARTRILADETGLRARPGRAPRAVAAAGPAEVAPGPGTSVVQP